jgi:hypothetical protein
LVIKLLEIEEVRGQIAEVKNHKPAEDLYL